MTTLLTRCNRLLSLGLLTVLSLTSHAALALEEGDQAPDFSVQGSDGNTYSLSQFIGVRPVVIAFFPKAFTGG